MHYLEKQGMKILERNFRCRTGEIQEPYLLFWMQKTGSDPTILQSRQVRSYAA